MMRATTFAFAEESISFEIPNLTFRFANSKLRPLHLKRPLLCPESARQAEARLGCGRSGRAHVPGDLPNVFPLVFHHATTVSIRCFQGFFKRSRAGFNRSPISSINIAHIHIQKRRRRFANSDIACQLNVSEEELTQRISGLLAKLNLKQRIELILYAHTDPIVRNKISVLTAKAKSTA